MSNQYSGTDIQRLLKFYWWIDGSPLTIYVHNCVMQLRSKTSDCIRAVAQKQWRIICMQETLEFKIRKGNMTLHLLIADDYVSHRIIWQVLCSIIRNNIKADIAVTGLCMKIDFVQWKITETTGDEAQEFCYTGIKALANMLYQDTSGHQLLCAMLLTHVYCPENIRFR